ncbi:AAA family ATPase [Chachezhania sediminis]|uniref:AAA family ATPase n=1 Tax=Chachezhania sediminis TaxID=2599291 RepID=UPI00131C24F3|nr:AAA family ATPase [Chachezhania sediminis]
MASLTYYHYSGERPIHLDEVEARNHHRSKITVIQRSHDDSCHVYFWLPNSTLGGRWYKHGPLSICFLSNDKNPEVIENSHAWEMVLKSDKGDSLVDAESEDLNFSSITMGMAALDYRTLVDEMGNHQAIEALLEANDIISMREYRPDSPIVKNIRLRKKIEKLLVRRTEQSFILDNGIEILRGSERASIDAARPEFRCDFRLPDGREYGFDFQFGSTQELGQRIAVLIGKNGSGKTQALRHTAKLALDSLSNEWRGNFTPSRVIGFYSTSRVSKVYPPQTLKRMMSGYRVCNIASEAGRSTAGVMDVLLQMIESDARIADTTRFNILLESLKQARGHDPVSIFHERYGPIELEKIQTASGGRGNISFSRPDIGDIQEATSDFLEAVDRSKGVFGREANDFSSGEAAYVRFCIFSSAYTENGSLVLLDEPEVFLHPQFIDAMMGSLQKVLELTGSVAVVATHSAYVVRCVQEDMVHIIRDKETSSFGNRMEVQKTRMKTFGADVGLISLFVFGEDEMETTTKRALGYISKSGQNLSSLRSIVSEDLFSKIVNKHEED